MSGRPSVSRCQAGRSIESSRPWKAEIDAMQAVALDLHFRKLGAQIVQRDETDEGAAAGNPALRFQNLARCVSTTMSKLFADWRSRRWPFRVRMPSAASATARRRGNSLSCGAPVSAGSWPSSSGRSSPSQITMRRFLSAIRPGTAKSGGWHRRVRCSVRGCRSPYCRAGGSARWRRALPQKRRRSVRKKSRLRTNRKGWLSPRPRPLQKRGRRKPLVAVVFSLERTLRRDADIGACSSESSSA
jgi:hypothetical protein